MLPYSFGFPTTNYLYQVGNYPVYNYYPSQYANIPPYWNFNTLPMNNIFQFEGRQPIAQPIKIENNQQHEEQVLLIKTNEQKSIQESVQKNLKITPENIEKQVKEIKKFEHLKYYDPFQAPILTSYKICEENQEENSRIQMHFDLIGNQYKKIEILNGSYSKNVVQEQQSSPFIIMKNANKEKPRRLLLAQIRKFRRSIRQKQLIPGKNKHKKNALKPLLLKSELNKMKKKIKKDYQQHCEILSKTSQSIRTRYQLKKISGQMKEQIQRIDKNENSDYDEFFVEKNQINQIKRNNKNVQRYQNSFRMSTRKISQFVEGNQNKK